MNLSQIVLLFSSWTLFSFAQDSDSRTKMPPRPQFSQPQQSFLAMEFHRRRGTKNFLPGLPADFAAQFPDAKVPSERAIRDLHKKCFALGTINNVNLKISPGVTHSDRPKTSTSDQRHYIPVWCAPVLAVLAVLYILSRLLVLYLLLILIYCYYSLCHTYLYLFCYS